MSEDRKMTREEAKRKAKAAKLAKRRRKVNRALLIIQALVSFIFTVAAYKFLPAKYKAAVAIILLLDFFMTYILLVLSGRQKNKAAAKKKRSAGCVISVITIIISLIGSFALIRVHQTLDGMNEDTMTVKIGVYVLKNDKAQEIEDAKDYQFGYTSMVEYENTMKAFDDIDKKVKQEVSKNSYDTAMELVDALYAKEAGAIVLNEAYVDVLSDMKDYKNFSDKTRLIYEVTIEKKVAERGKNNLTKEPFIVYLSGSDTRDTKLSTSRNDVNILAVVNPVNKQVLLVNTPRDCQIDLSVKPGQMDKLTHCGIYGIDCSMDTLGNFYGVDVNYYAQINFSGIIKLVDTLGGVTVESDRAFKTRTASSLNDDTRYEFVKGENEVDGHKALAFARERKAIGDGDLGRGIHQMALIKAIAKKAMSPAILKDFNGLLDSVKDMSATNLTASEMESLVQMQLDDPAEWNIVSYCLTGKGQKAHVASMAKKVYTMVPDQESYEKAKSLIDKVMKGETISEEDTKNN